MFLAVSEGGRHPAEPRPISQSHVANLWQDGMCDKKQEAKLSSTNMFNREYRYVVLVAENVSDLDNSGLATSDDVTCNACISRHVPGTEGFFGPDCFSSACKSPILHLQRGCP